MERIGEYVVRRLVGEGGMGKVYEAEERLSRRRVALKVLRPELTKSEDCRRMFLNEMRILAHLEHPHVVRSLASTEVDGQLVMALEFLEGRTLREELTARGKLGWQEAVAIAADVASALAAAHAQEPSIVHRDLKPENVMLGAAGLKVMDFGIAKVLEQAQGTSTQSVGTLQYMSPEQIDAGSLDGRSDVYALGIVLYEMLSGAPPFGSPSPRELLNLQCTASPPALSAEARDGLPGGVEDLLFEMLEKAPDDRPSGAAEVERRLRAFCATGAPRTTRSGRRAGAAADVARAPAAPTAPEGRGAGRRGDTMPSSPPRRRQDTVELVARATAPREITAGVALVLVCAVSLAAGLATYVARVGVAGAPPPAATASNTGPREAR